LAELIRTRYIDASAFKRNTYLTRNFIEYVQYNAMFFVKTIYLYGRTSLLSIIFPFCIFFLHIFLEHDLLYRLFWLSIHI